MEISYAQLQSGTTGSYCTFVKIGNRGLKCYNSPNERDRHYRWQVDLSLQSLAPETYGCVDCTLPDGSVKYAYWTEIADVAEDVHGIDWFESGENADFDELCEKLYAADYPWNDDHSSNWGYCNGRAVIIDCPGY